MLQHVPFRPADIRDPAVTERGEVLRHAPGCRVVVDFDLGNIRAGYRFAKGDQGNVRPRRPAAAVARLAEKVAIEENGPVHLACGRKGGEMRLHWGEPSRSPMIMP